MKEAFRKGNTRAEKHGEDSVAVSIRPTESVPQAACYTLHLHSRAVICK